MQVRVLFFGILKDVAGRSSDVLTLPAHSTTRDLVKHYEERVAGLQGILSSIAISVNQEYASSDIELRANDEVALLPPVSGGMDDGPYIRLVRERIVPHEIIPALECPEDGAIVIFDGVVRNNSRGRRTLYLVYEAYEEMALKQLHSL